MPSGCAHWGFNHAVLHKPPGCIDWNVSFRLFHQLLALGTDMCTSLCNPYFDKRVRTSTAFQALLSIDIQTLLIAPLNP
jgi:hypothetical protein